MAPPAPEVLTPDAARRGALRAQCLLEPTASIEEALEQTVGVSGAIPSGSLSLAVRVSAFALPTLDHALEDDRSVVRVPAMRGAVYLLPTRLVSNGLALAKPGQFRPALMRAGMKEETYDALVESIEDMLTGKHLTGTELRRALGSERIERDLPKGAFVFFLRGLTHEAASCAWVSGEGPGVRRSKTAAPTSGLGRRSESRMKRRASRDFCPLI